MWYGGYLGRKMMRRLLFLERLIILCGYGKKIRARHVTFGDFADESFRHIKLLQITLDQLIALRCFQKY